MSSKNVFVIALDDFNRRKLESLRIATECRFHRLLSDEVLSGARGYDVERMLVEGERELGEFEGSVDAVLAYRDFPESTIQPILAQQFGVPSASLEAVLKCEHKYWSRLEQQKAVPDSVPRFVRFHPFDESPRAEIDMSYPFWMKPVKSFASHLGFKIESDVRFQEALEETRRHVRRLAEPFDRILERADVPPEAVTVGEVYCLAERIIAGRQCTVEGCRSGGSTQVLGVVDSVRVPGGSSFQRYQYPSRLPERVQRRMADVTRRVVEQFGYDDACFNVEFFWDDTSDHLWLIEINPRIALHHADLFEKVDGYSNYEMAVEVGLGRSPSFTRNGGPFEHAATFFVREPADAVVTRVPSPERLREIEQAFPGTLIELRVEQGMRLSDLTEQDAYSYALALIYVGGQDEQELERTYHHVVDALDIGLDHPAPHRER
ncbi:MAG: ATP-grasp domain-containing protein [Myxococcota bacterium]